ncbi:DUF6281 family protein [Streptomyces sp. NPDC002928]|uniref:DUF6281 family protein n=1 Tax=Streptomyces sp. NPDC002928 TaxID=3154440 RepID=UPI0033AB2C7A
MKAVLPVGRHGSVWALLAAVVVTTSAACTVSDDDGGDKSAPSCAYVIDYQNRRYSARESAEITVGDKLGAATIPSCEDSPNYDPDGRTPPSSTIAYAIEGVDPAVAISVSDASKDIIFVNVESDEDLPPEVSRLINGS